MREGGGLRGIGWVVLRRRDALLRVPAVEALFFVFVGGGGGGCCERVRAVQEGGVHGGVVRDGAELVALLEEKGVVGWMMEVEGWASALEVVLSWGCRGRRDV